MFVSIAVHRTGFFLEGGAYFISLPREPGFFFGILTILPTELEFYSEKLEYSPYRTRVLRWEFYNSLSSTLVENSMIMPTEL